MTDEKTLTPNDRYQYRPFVRRTLGNPNRTAHDVDLALKYLNDLNDDADALLTLVADLRIAAGADVPSSEAIEDDPLNDFRFTVQPDPTPLQFWDAAGLEALQAFDQAREGETKRSDAHIASYELKTINVPLENDTPLRTDVTAKCLGQWAAHRAFTVSEHGEVLEAPDSRYIVTHVLSGHSAARGIVSEQEALRLMELINGVDDMDALWIEYQQTGNERRFVDNSANTRRIVLEFLDNMRRTNLKFKVGDLVVASEDADDHDSEIGVIVQLDPGDTFYPYCVEFDGDAGWMAEEDLAPATDETKRSA